MSARIQIAGGFFEPATHAYYDLSGAHVPGCTTVLRDAGMVCYDGIREDVLRRKALIGTAAHAAAHYFDEGDLDEGSVAPEARGYVEAWKRFRAESDFRPQLLEYRMVGNYRGRTVGGTLDRVGTFRGAEWICELKCTARVEASWGPQTALYETLERSLGGSPKMRRRVVIWLKPSGAYSLIEQHDVSDYRVAGLALAAHYTTHPGAKAYILSTIRQWMENKGGCYGSNGDRNRVA